MSCVPSGRGQINNNMIIDDVNWIEVGKYLAVMMSKEEIIEEGLSHVIPKREGVRLRNITINYLRQKRNNNKWLPARSPGVRQKRKMLALAVGYGVYTTMSCHTYKVGDEVYQQLGGGSIGLELTGAVARPFMLRWDTLYRDRIKTAGQDLNLDLVMYERYVDDSNQVVTTPPQGARYDVISKKVVIDDNHNDTLLNDEERTAKLYTDIANDIVHGITMEFDVPSRNSDNKMPILDMKVWMNEEKYLLFQHYEKPTASRNILHAQSAQSVSCRNSVHTQEILRRILNTSPLLDWSSCVAPVLTDYMLRMMRSGYPEKYRLDTLNRALRIYDHMVEQDSNGTRPLYRQKDWNRVDKLKKKTRKKHEWSTRGGFIAPIFVAPTLNSELANSLRAIAGSEAEAGVHFRIIETGDISVKSILQRSNPMEIAGCVNDDCLPCKPGRGEGGHCCSYGVNYEMEWQLCPDEQREKYIGETSRNLYSRSTEHLKTYRSGDQSSFILKHQNSKHNGAAPMFKAKVTAQTRDCLSRQVREAVLIRRSQVPVLNGKSEWHQPALFRVQMEMERG